MGAPFRIEFERSGGFAGVSLKTSVDSRAIYRPTKYASSTSFSTASTLRRSLILQRPPQSTLISSNMTSPSSTAGNAST